MTCGVCSGYGGLGRWYVSHPLYWIAGTSSTSKAICLNCGTEYRWET